MANGAMYVQVTRQQVQYKTGPAALARANGRFGMRYVPAELYLYYVARTIAVVDANATVHRR
jgi:hypothetical protein